MGLCSLPAMMSPALPVVLFDGLRLGMAGPDLTEHLAFILTAKGSLSVLP